MNEPKRIAKARQEKTTKPGQRLGPLAFLLQNLSKAMGHMSTETTLQYVRFMPRSMQERLDSVRGPLPKLGQLTKQRGPLKRRRSSGP